MKRIIVVGGGFAGLWSAVGAARGLRESGDDAHAASITLISRDPYLTVRPRLYEARLADDVRVPLDPTLEPVGIHRVEGEVTAIDTGARTLSIRTPEGSTTTREYDRLVLAAGSRQTRPDIPGLQAHAFSVDTYHEARALHRHLDALPDRSFTPGLYTVVIIGAGFTGIEAAAEMATRMRKTAVSAGRPGEGRVVLVERDACVGPALGAAPRPIIEEALESLGVEILRGTTVAAIEEDGVLTGAGARIPAATAIVTAGLCASPLTAEFPVELDALGRLPVDEGLRVRGVAGVLAAGDVAHAMTDEAHPALMSCQHALYMGRYAGHNVVCDLLGERVQPYRQPVYRTCLDLGAWGALYTEGWARSIRKTGEEGKAIKRMINRERIYPPIKDPEAILNAAALPEW